MGSSIEKIAQTIIDEVSKIINKSKSEPNLNESGDGNYLMIFQTPMILNDIVDILIKEPRYNRTIEHLLKKTCF